MVQDGVTAAPAQETTMTDIYVKDTSGEVWWCNAHQRPATHIGRKPGFAIDRKHHCDPQLGGIMIPCDCVNLTGIAEIVESE